MKSLDKIIDDKILFEDIQRISNNRVLYQKFDKKSIFITGATGLIGSHIVKTLLYINYKEGLNIKIIAAARNQEKAIEILGEDKNLIYYDYELEKEIEIKEKIDYIVHCAAITQSKKFIENPSEVIKSMISGTMNILECAKKHSSKVLFLSSMEIYGVENFKNGEFLKECDYGYIDLLNVRSSYVEGKRIGELLCHTYSVEHKVETCIARICQTFGAGVHEEDERMFAQFAKAALYKKNIVLFSTGETVRSYCYLSDTVSALFYLILLGKSGEAYNIANEDMTMSVKEIAHLVAKRYKIDVEYQIEERKDKGYLPVLQMKMNTEKIKALGWKPEIGMLESFERMIKSMEDAK